MLRRRRLPRPRPGSRPSALPHLSPQNAPTRCVCVALRYSSFRLHPRLRALSLALMARTFCVLLALALAAAALQSTSDARPLPLSLGVGIGEQLAVSRRALGYDEEEQRRELVYHLDYVDPNPNNNPTVSAPVAVVFPSSPPPAIFRWYPQTDP